MFLLCITLLIFVNGLIKIYLASKAQFMNAVSLFWREFTFSVFWSYVKNINSAVVEYFDKMLKSLHLRQKYSYICSSEIKINMGSEY